MDIRPLTESASFRNLWFGLTVSQLGHQIATTTVIFQVYEATRSPMAVGALGLAAVMPTVLVGLLGGAVADAYDRRRVALVSSVALWLVSWLFLLQAVVAPDRIVFLYVLVALQSGMTAISQPTRTAMMPRLLPPRLLPSANALNAGSYNLGFTVGPLIAAGAIGLGDYALAYSIDVVTFLAALYAVVKLPPMPTQREDGDSHLRMVIEGFSFLRRAPNIRTTFVLDLIAMVLAQPRAILPAVASSFFVGGRATVGLLIAAPAVGAMIGLLVSGWLRHVRRQGWAITLAIMMYGASVAAFGVTRTLWVGLLLLGIGGAADMVSAAYRNTLMQVAAPDHMRGRLQGVYTVVVASGPRVGEFVMGSAAVLLSPTLALLGGGALCCLGTAMVVAMRPAFRAYDAQAPTP